MYETVFVLVTVHNTIFIVEGLCHKLAVEDHRASSNL